MESLNKFWPLYRWRGWINYRLRFRCWGFFFSVFFSHDEAESFPASVQIMKLNLCWPLFRWWGNLVLASVQMAWPTHVILAFALMMRLHYFRPLFRRRGRIVFWTSLRCNHRLLPRFQCDRPNRNRPAPYTVCRWHRKKICPLSKYIHM